MFYLKTRDESGEILPTFETVLDVDISSQAQKALGKDGTRLDTRLLSVIYDYDGDLWFVTGAEATPASYLLRAQPSGVTEPTVLTFLVNGLEGDASR